MGKGRGTAIVIKNKTAASVYGVSSPEATLGQVGCRVHFMGGAGPGQDVEKAKGKVQSQYRQSSWVFRTLSLPFADTHWVPVMFLTSLRPGETMN